MDSFSVPKFLLYPGIQWWASQCCSSGCSTSIQSKPQIPMGCRWHSHNMDRPVYPFPQCATVRILCPDQSYFKFPQSTQWNFVQCANSKSSPSSGLELMPSCFAIYTYLKFLLWWLILCELASWDMWLNSSTPHKPHYILQNYMEFWKYIYTGFCKKMLHLNEKAKRKKRGKNMSKLEGILLCKSC